MVCLEDTRFILVRAEYPYVQFVAAARVTSTEKFVVGVTNGRERDRSQVSGGVLFVMRCGEPMLCDALVRCPLVGRPAFPFIA